MKWVNVKKNTENVVGNVPMSFLNQTGFLETIDFVYIPGKKLIKYLMNTF